MEAIAAGRNTPVQDCRGERTRNPRSRIRPVSIDRTGYFRATDIQRTLRLAHPYVGRTAMGPIHRPPKTTQHRIRPNRRHENDYRGMLIYGRQLDSPKTGRFQNGPKPNRATIQNIVLQKFFCDLQSRSTLGPNGLSLPAAKRAKPESSSVDHATPTD